MQTKQPMIDDAIPQLEAAAAEQDTGPERTATDDRAEWLPVLPELPAAEEQHRKREGMQQAVAEDPPTLSRIYVEVVPLEKLQYSWEYEGYPGYSLVTFHLIGTGSQTKVRLTHHGLETFPQGNDDFAWKSFNGGWNEIIGRMLPEFLSTLVR